MARLWWAPHAVIALFAALAVPFIGQLFLRSPRYDFLTGVEPGDSTVLVEAKSLARVDLDSHQRVVVSLGTFSAIETFRLALLSAASPELRDVRLTLAPGCDAADTRVPRVVAALSAARLLDSLWIDAAPGATCAVAVIPRILSALGSNRRLVVLRLTGLREIAQDGGALTLALVSLLSHQPRLQLLALHADDESSDAPSGECCAASPPPLRLLGAWTPLQNLVELSLRGVELSPASLQLLRPLLHWRLRQLDLRGSWLGEAPLSAGEDDATGLQDGGPGCAPPPTWVLPSMRALLQPQSRVSAEGSDDSARATAVALLAQSLAGMQRLQDLDLSCVRGLSIRPLPGALPDGESAAATAAAPGVLLGALLPALPRLVALRVLLARGLGLPGAAVRAVIESAADLPSLRLLDLAGSGPGVTEEWLGSVLSQVRPLRHLRVRVRDVAQDGV